MTKPSDPFVWNGNIDDLLRYHKMWAGDLRMGPDPDPPTPPTPPTPPPTPPTPPTPPPTSGYPENTPVADMTAEQQIAYWKHHSQKHENLWKQADLKPQEIEALRTKAAEFDKIQHDALTPSEKQIADARAEGEIAALTRIAPDLVAASITSYAAGRLDMSKAQPLLDSLDHSRFLSDAGKPDADKVKAWVDSLVSAMPANSNNRQGHGPDMGQGNRQQATTTGAAAGLAEAERRYGKPAS